MSLRIYKDKIININTEEFIQMLNRDVVIDCGFGDGKFLLNQALKNPDTFFIGIDSSFELLKNKYKKIKKHNLNNLVYVISSIQNFPKIKLNASKIYINFPWSDLLAFLVNAEPDFFSKLNFFLNKKGIVEIYISYDKNYDGNLISHHDLPELSAKFFKKIWKQKISKLGFEMSSIEVLDDAFEPHTSWGKELLKQKRKRIVYKVLLQKVKELKENKQYTFEAWGHPNLTAKHSKTIEFTKDEEITISASCILGVRANFKINKLKEFSGKITLKFSVYDYTKNTLLEHFVKCIVNDDFYDKNELVLRKSKFNSPRTYGVNLNHGAQKINRDIVNLMKNRDQKMEITIIKGWF